MGPLDRDPSDVAFAHPLDRLVATAIDERLVISDGSPNGVAFALGSLAGRTSGELEVALSDDGSAGTRSASR